MKTERNYMKCSICGNLIGVIQDSGVVPVCCGTPMQHLSPNTTDAAQEKHVPVIERSGSAVTVKVGSAMHPMSPEHYIQWVALAQGNKTQRVALAPTDSPEVAFQCEAGPATVYAYCNLHGLWASEQ